MLKSKQIRNAIVAWESGKCSDGDLDIAIEAIDFTLVTLRACGANWVMTMGLQTTLTSMSSARDARIRDRKPKQSRG